MYNGACQVTAFWYVVTKLQQDTLGKKKKLHTHSHLHRDDTIHTFLYTTLYQRQEVPTENRLGSRTGAGLLPDSVLWHSLKLQIQTCFFFFFKKKVKLWDYLKK